MGIRRRRHWQAIAALLALAGLAAAGPARAQVFLTQEEALRLAFPPPAKVERRTAFLDDRALAAARRLAGEGADVDETVVTYYVGTHDGTPLGAAYFDVHRVRTRPEVLMIVVGPDDRIDRIEVLKFAEPPEYRAPGTWIEQFHGRALDDELSLKGAIRNMTGASLTSRAVTNAARRVLALHRAIRPFGTAAPSDSTGGGTGPASGGAAGDETR